MKRSNGYKALTMAGVSLAAGVIACKAHPIAVLPAAVVASAGGVAACRQGISVGLGSWLRTYLDIGSTLLTLGDSVQVDPTKLQVEGLPSPLEEWFAAIADSGTDPTTPNFWTQERALNSSVILGGRGSGKTYLASWKAATIASAGVDLKLSDIHYGAGDHVWLDGMDRDAFEKSILIQSAQDTYLAILSLQSELASRIERKATDERARHLIIEEWTSVIADWSEEQLANAVKALRYIADSGRKFGIDVTLILHDLTQTRTGLNEGLLSQFDLYAMGDSLSCTTFTFPASLSRSREKLLKSLAVTRLELAIPQRAFAFRDALGESKVIISPDWKSHPVVVELVDTRDELRDQVAPLVCQGHGITHIARELGISKGSTGRYPLLKQIVEELKSDVEIS